MPRPTCAAGCCAAPALHAPADTDDLQRFVEVNGFLEALARLVHELPHTLDRPPRIPSGL